MQTGLICFELVAKLNNVDFDSRAVIKEHALPDKEINLNELVRIAQKTQFKVKKKEFLIDHFSPKYPLPAIFQFLDLSFGVLLQIDFSKKQCLIFKPQEKNTQALSFSQFTALVNPIFIILKHKVFNSKIQFGFKWFFKEMLTYKQIIVEVLVGSFIVQLFGLVTPLFTQVILDKVIVHRSLSTLNVLAVAFIIITVFELVLNISRNYLFIHTTSKIDAKLGAKLFKHLFSLPFRYFESRKVGNIVARVRELDQIREFIANKAVSVIIDLFFSLVFVLMMLLYSVKLTLIVLTVVAIIGLIYFVVTPIFREKLEDKFQMGAQSNSYLVESITGIHTVKALAIEGGMQRKWEDYLGKYINSSFNLGVIGTFTGNFTQFLQKILTISILFIGVQLVIGQELSIGQLIAFQMFSNQFINPILRLVGLWNEFQQALLGVDRLGDILNQPTEVSSEKAITLSKINGSLKLENVFFKYHPEMPEVVSDFSLKIEAGQSIGIVGRSGSGKSTITKLIQRLYLANQGSIYLDDIDIRHMNPNWLRNNIGAVLQENYLFSGTIRENIALAKPDASMELIIKTAKLSSAHEFIAQFPEGYDTMVGERGSTLSGGQKQRIAIARALITNPKILIFDEATSALDLESENIILQHLKNIQQGRTTIIIAHRLSTVKNCDLIVALDKGRIIEQGTHDNLLKANGYYASLLNLIEHEKNV